MREFIHAWEIKGMVNISLDMKLKIKNLLLKKFRSFQNASKFIGLTGVQISFLLRHKSAFTRIHNLFKITDNINLPRDEVEREIVLFKDFTNGMFFL